MSLPRKMKRKRLQRNEFLEPLAQINQSIICEGVREIAETVPKNKGHAAYRV